MTTLLINREYLRKSTPNFQLNILHMQIFNFYQEQ